MKKKIFIFFLLMLVSRFVNGQTLHLYGGPNHDVYLGCLNCNNYDSNSIWNTYGNYGSVYNSNSIWNKYGTYGSEYNSYSPWNSYTTTNPVVVDQQGNFYGYFTTNKYRSKRADFKLAILLCDN